VFADLAGTFNFSDIPFAIVFLLYILFIIIQRTNSKAAFLVSLLFFILMGLSYIPTATGKITERLGEWFYLFFVFGLVQYTSESWRPKLK
jgi:predicted membrane channel-forming protein YqfA (hemolysin III family)